MNCPQCDQELKEMESKSIFMDIDDIEKVWVCVNKCCDNYHKIVYNEGDLE